jgi:hypothetical protein
MTESEETVVFSDTLFGDDNGKKLLNRVATVERVVSLFFVGTLVR